MGGLPYSPDLYEQYGAVLLATQDAMQAGKYLFLSGRWREEYAAAIDLFLMRYGRGRPGALVSEFPSRARVVPLDTFPDNVREALLARGVPRAGPGRSPAGPRSLRATLGVWAAAALLLLALALALASMTAGLPIVFAWLRAWW